MPVLSALQIVIRIIVIITIAELAIMLLLGKIEFFGYWGMAILDVVLLVLITSPAIYFWVINPFIQAREQAMEHVHRLAHTDPLTDIANRRQLMQLIRMELARCKRYDYFGALLLIDLNRFKPINDNYGHDAGDGVLREIAERLNGQVREGDAVGRLGGDEFVILMSQLGNSRDQAINELGQIAQRLVLSLKEPVDCAGTALKVTASIGITLINAESPEIEEIMKQVDTAMYTAKQFGQGFNIQFHQDAEY